MPTLDFKGKPFVYSHHLSVPFRELKIDAGKSLAGEGGPSLDDNLIIHGDNLHALKALLPKYAGKVDVIYIDPPYNTGNEGWAYNDNVNSPLMKEWLGKVVDEEDLERHDKWLCMMWPRLVLLRELLSDDGVILVSIDNIEVTFLDSILKEIFGIATFVDILTIERSKNGLGSKEGFSTNGDYVLCYKKDSKNKDTFHGLRIDEDFISKFNKEDEFGKYKTDGIFRKKGQGQLRSQSPGCYYPIFYEKGGKVFLENGSGRKKILPLLPNGDDGRWIWSPEFAENRMHRLYASQGGTIYVKDYLSDAGNRKPRSVWTKNKYLTEVATKEIQSIFGSKTFPTPKPLQLISDLIENASKKNSVILDSFAGSGTTAHAVQALNAEDGGNRKFILVETEDYADTITAERVRRVMQGVPNAKDEALKNGLGGSFTYCDLGEPIDMESFFGESKSMPAYDQLARYIAYTATGEAMDKAPKKPAKDWFIGEVGGVRLHLIYKPDIAFMKSHYAALDMDTVKTIAAGNKTGKPSYVFAAAKYMGQTELTRDFDMTFCQLPYAIHRIMGDGVDG